MIDVSVLAQCYKKVKFANYYDLQINYDFEKLIHERSSNVRPNCFFAVDVDNFGNSCYWRWILQTLYTIQFEASCKKHRTDRVVVWL